MEIHAHLGCPICKRPVYDCCDGETAENNPHHYAEAQDNQEAKDAEARNLQAAIDSRSDTAFK